MIVAVYGVPGLSFAEVTYMLTSLGIGYVAVEKGPKKIGGPSPDHVIPVVFNSAKQFIDNRNKIKFRAVPLICDSFHKLHTELKLPVIGVEATKKGPVYLRFSQTELGDLLQKADKLTEPVDLRIEFKAHDPTRKMIRKFAESALSQTQTVVYRVKNQELRSKTFGLIKDWFTGKIKSKEGLKLKVYALHRNEKYGSDLETILLSAHGIALRNSVIEAQKNPARIETVCKRNKISPFDVRYLLSKTDR